MLDYLRLEQALPELIGYESLPAKCGRYKLWRLVYEAIQTKDEVLEKGWRKREEDSDRRVKELDQDSGESKIIRSSSNRVSPRICKECCHDD